MLVDGGLAVALSVVGVVGLTRPADGALFPVAVGLTLVATSAVAWRDRAPVVAVVSAAAATVGYQWLTRANSFPLGAGLALLFLLYTAGVRGLSRRHLAELAGLGVMTIGMSIAIVAASGPLKGSTVVTDVLPPLGAVAVGYVVARQRRLTGDLTAAVTQLRAEEELRVAVSATRERNRVARELHDVVAHGVSVMVVQAGLARITVGAEPSVARAALAEITTAGRSAIDDLHRVVGALRLKDTDTSRPPSGVAGVGALVEGWRAAGVPVQLSITGDCHRLSAAQDATCFRLVQEALTNVVKHALGAPIWVELVLQETGVEVSVRNGAPPDPNTASLAPESGHGLAGMTERVASCGGQLSYGPQPDGGFEVRASLPLEGNSRYEVRRQLPLFEWLRSLGTGPAVVLALAVLWGDAAISASRRGSFALNLSLCAGMALSLLMRRRFPLLFLIVVNALAFPISNGLTSINKATVVSTYVFAVPIWSVAAWSEINIAFAGLVVAIGFEVAEGLHWHFSPGSVGSNAVVSAVLWAAGRVMRRQRKTSADLAEARARVEAAQQARERLAVIAARSRMIPDLDDLVVAQLATMVADAESARRKIEADKSAALVAIGNVEDQGRKALAQLRDIVGLLRAEHDPGRLSPLLGVEQLDQLVSRHTRSDRPTQFTVTGTPAPLRDGIDLLAYRVIAGVLANAHCDTVNLHFDDAGSLRLGFCLAGSPSGSAWPDPTFRAAIEQASGNIDQTPQQIVVQLPIASVVRK